MASAVVWWGHSTVLIEIDGARFLTDPLLRRRLVHITRRAPAVDPTALGRIDAVLISHAHRDHLDLPTLRSLGGGVPVIAPRGAARHLRGLGDVHELEAGASLTLRGTKLTATPAVHTAMRGGRRIPALGYLIGPDVYFAGDTDLFDAMAALAPLRLALLPVWGYGPSLGPGHLDPARAADALALLRPRMAVPIHWGTYFPAYRGLRGHRLLTEPPLDFARRAAEIAPDVRVVVLRPGERLELSSPAPG